MTATCPPRRELLRLLDGEATENRALELRAHAATCPACAAELRAHEALLARVAAPVEGLSTAGAVEAVMARVRAAPPERRRAPSRRGRLLSGLAAAAAVAIAALVLAPRGRDAGEFRARGAGVEWTRKVGVELWALDAGPRRLSAGDSLAPGVPLVASFSNVDDAPAYLLAYALDARGEVHWVYPAWLDPRTDPQSVTLDAAAVNRALPDSVVLEDVAPGQLSFVLVTTRAPLRVSSIEHAPAVARTPEAVRARWPGARVETLPVRFGPAPPAVPEARP